MSFLAGAITGSLELETGSFEQGFVKAEGLMELFPTLVTDFMADPILGFAELAKETLSSLFEFMSSSFEESLGKATEISKASKNLGVPPEVLSSLSRMTGSLDETSEAFKFLAKNQADAMHGGQAALEVFGRYGVAFREADGSARPLANVLNDVADKMKNLPEGAARVDLATGLLGRGGNELIRVLSGGSEAMAQQAEQAKAWGAVVSDEAAATAAHFTLLESNVGTAWDGIKETLGDQIQVALTPILEDFVAWLNTNRPQILAWIKEIGSVVQDVAQIVRTAIQDTLSILSAIGVGSAITAVTDLAKSVADLGASTFGTTSAPAQAQSSNTTINVAPIDSSSSIQQISHQVQKGFRQQRSQYQDDLDVTQRRMDIQDGL